MLRFGTHWGDPIWGPGPNWGSHFGTLGPIWVPFGSIWGPFYLGPIWGPFLFCLGPIWGPFGPIWGPFGALLGPFGAHLRPFGAHWILGPFGPSLLSPFGGAIGNVHLAVLPPPLSTCPSSVILHSPLVPCGCSGKICFHPSSIVRTSFIQRPFKRG